MKATFEDLKKELWLRARNSGEIVWETKEGRLIPIKDMSDSHLVNAINMIIRLITKAEEKAQKEWELLEALGSIGDTEI